MYLIQCVITTTNTPQPLTPIQKAGKANGIYFQNVLFQNNGSNDMRLGDESVSATKGIRLSASGSLNDSLPIEYGGTLNDWWVNGTAGDKLDILVNP